jgi:hypothetical protein
MMSGDITRGGSQPLVDRSALEAAVLLVCYTAGLLAAAAVTFRRRDAA